MRTSLTLILLFFCVAFSPHLEADPTEDDAIVSSSEAITAVTTTYGVVVPAIASEATPQQMVAEYGSIVDLVFDLNSKLENAREVNASENTVQMKTAPMAVTANTNNVILDFAYIQIIEPTQKTGDWQYATSTVDLAEVGSWKFPTLPIQKTIISA